MTTQNVDLTTGITLTDAKAGCGCGGHGAGHAHGGSGEAAAAGCACGVGGHGHAAGGATSAAPAGCACGGHGAGGGHGHHHGGHGHHHGESATDAAPTPVTTTVGVTGMTCEHCVASVTEEVSAYEGVTGVSVDLVPGGVSRVTVTSIEPIAYANLDAAIQDAGYQLASQ